MKRTKLTRNQRVKRLKSDGQRIQTLQSQASMLLARAQLAHKLGMSYDGQRNLYKALGYPDEEELDYEYFLGKYERQEIATTIIDKPVDKSWNAFQFIEDVNEEEDNESSLKKQWNKLQDDIQISNELNKLDKLMGIGHYAILLLGLSDVKSQKDFQMPVAGKVNLVYVNAIGESNASITEWETSPRDKRYGQPNYYQVTIGGVDGASNVENIRVHHSRVVHVCSQSIHSKVFGRPRLKPLINRLLDVEKILGGDAEMFWRGARPGYTALAKEEYELDDDQITDLENQLRKFENDLSRFLTAEGVDIKALAPQVADPSNHFDIQIQAISAQTNIPKRILVGSERGELSSAQDETQWLNHIKTRQEDFVEPMVIKPVVRKLMDYGVLPKQKEYVVVWEDLFAPSEKDKADVGQTRATSLKNYGDSIGAQDILPPKVFFKYILGFDDDVIQDIENEIEEMVDREETDFESDAEQQTVRMDPNENEVPERQIVNQRLIKHKLRA